MLSESLKSIWTDPVSNTEVFLLNTDEISSSVIADAYFVMSEERRAVCDNLKINEDKIRCISADYLARLVLSLKTGLSYKEIKFEKSRDGKPELVNGRGHFNISHSGKYVALAFNEQKRVGVDVEYIRPIKTGLLSRVCSDDEISFVFGSRLIPSDTIGNKDILERFFRLWTYKEAFLKCIGTGIAAEIKKTPFDMNCPFFVIDGYALSVVTE